MRGKKRKTGSIVLAAALFVLAVRLPAITVISPNGGESWVIGTPVTVRWSPTADGVNVRIILYRDGTDEAHRLGNVVNSTPGVAGSYSWTAGVHDGGRAVAGASYYVRVRVVGTDEADASDAGFVLLGTISVTSPMETAVYEASTSTLHAAWTAADVSGSVRIDLERQDGTERYVIADSVVAGGSPLDWPVPLATAEGTYRVKVSQGATQGSSGRCFVMAYRPPNIKVLQPNGGEELVMGNSYPIRWLPHHLEGNLRVELLKDGRLVGALSDSSPVGGMCSYSWDGRTCAGRELLPGRGFRIRVTTLDGAHTDDSDGSFALTPRSSIALFRPNKGETWVSGAVEDIRWTFMKLDGYVVELHLRFPDPARPTGHGGFLIASGVPVADGRFAWTVGTLRNAGPVLLAPGLVRDCTIFLRATKAGAIDYWCEGPPFKISTLAGKILKKR